MSRAVVTWPGLGRPEALRKVVRDMPMARALAVILAANADLGAGDVFRHRDGDVVGRLRHQGEDRILDGDRLAGLQAELRGRLSGGVLGDGDARAEAGLAAVDGLEEQVEGHHLGQRGGIALAVGVAGVEDLAGLGVDDDRCIAGGLGEAGAGDEGEGNDPGGHERTQWLRAEFEASSIASASNVQAPHLPAMPGTWSAIEADASNTANSRGSRRTGNGRHRPEPRKFGEPPGRSSLANRPCRSPRRTV